MTTQTIPQTTTLRQRAMVALAEQQQQEANYRAREREQLTARCRAQFKDDFGQEPKSVDGNQVQVGDDGDLKGGALALRWMGGGRIHVDAWQLRGACPTCREECWSQPIRDLLQLGEQLAHFEPAKADHRCLEPIEKAIEPASAAELVLLEALRNYVQEVRCG